MQKFLQINVSNLFLLGNYVSTIWNNPPNNFYITGLTLFSVHMSVNTKPVVMETISIQYQRCNFASNSDKFKIACS